MIAWCGSRHAAVSRGKVRRPGLAVSGALAGASFLAGAQTKTKIKIMSMSMIKIKIMIKMIETCRPCAVDGAAWELSGIVYVLPGDTLGVQALLRWGRAAD